MGQTYPGAIPSSFKDDLVHGLIYKVHKLEPMFNKFDASQACGEGYPEPYEFQLYSIDVRMGKD